MNLKKNTLHINIEYCKKYSDAVVYYKGGWSLVVRRWILVEPSLLGSNSKPLYLLLTSVACIPFIIALVDGSRL
jgi:hypothetical protein